MKKFQQPEQPEQPPIEQSRLDNLIRAGAIAKRLFGASSTYATGEIADYLEDADDEAEKEFSEDLHRATEYASTLFEVETPTAEQVFFTLERVILAETE